MPRTMLGKPSASQNLFMIGIFLISFCMYLLFNQFFPVTDPVESNYALTAKEMVQSSDWISPRIYGNVWYDKPVFFYWLTAIGYKVFGFSDFSARVAPALFAAMSLVLLYWFAVKISGQRSALLAICILGTSLEFFVLSKLIITDMILFFWNSAALVLFYLGYTNWHGSKRWYFGMYASMAFAVLTKGPVGILLPGTVMAAMIVAERKWSEVKNLSIISGGCLFLVIAVPWYWAMYTIHGADFVNTFFGIHNYLRATVSEHPKDNVSYYYIVVFFLSLFPWSPLAAKALIAKGKEWYAGRSPDILFCFIWFAVYFIFYSLMATKYITYIFPVLLPVALLTANYLEELFSQNYTAAIIKWIGIPFTCAVLAYVFLAYKYLAGQAFFVVAAGLSAILVLTWIAAAKKNTGAQRVFFRFFIGQLICYLMLAGLVFPAVFNDRSGRELATVVREYRDYRIATYDFYSTSLVYYTGNIAVKLDSAGDAAAAPQRASDWSGKYTMPMETLKGFIEHNRMENMLIIVPNKKKPDFEAEARAFNLQQLGSDKEYSYFTYQIK